MAVIQKYQRPESLQRHNKILLTLVKQKDFRVSNQSSRDSDSLLLTPGELRALVTDHGVKAIGKADNKVVLWNESQGRVRRCYPQDQSRTLTMFASLQA